MHKKCVVRLSAEARVVCQEISKHLKGSAQKFRRAQLWLKADAAGPGGSDVKRAEAFNCRVQTIEPLRKRLVMAGCALALDGKQRPEPPTPGKLEGAAQAQRIARRRGKPPAGDGHWTWPRLAEERVAWEIVDAMRHATVRKVRKNMA